MTHDNEEKSRRDASVANAGGTSTSKAASILSRIDLALAAAVVGVVFLVTYSVDVSFRGSHGSDADLVVAEGTLEASNSGRDPFKVEYRRCECQQCPDANNATGLMSLDQNAPLAIIGGTMKGGTRALLTYLGEHPEVYSDQGREVHLFDERHYEHVFPKDDIFRYSSKVDQCAVLRTYKEIFEDKRRQQQIESGRWSEERIFFDKTPSYMVYSHIIPQRILCTFPDVKVIMILRNPVDRTYSHYQHCVKKYRDVPGCNGKSFEESVEEDMAALERAGVLAAASSMEEYNAWARYHNVPGKAKGNLMIAKSLYAIQLRQWIAVFRDHFGQDNFLNHLLLLESEWMHTHKQAAYFRTLDFVGLPPHLLEEGQDYHVGRYMPMSNATRKQLENFFRPFNKNLKELLSPLGIELSWARDDK